MMMPNVKKDVLGDLVRYLRKLEIEEKDEGEEMPLAPKSIEGLMKEASKVDPEKDEGSPEEEKLDLEEPDLEMGPEEEGADDQLSPEQVKLRDFFNNKRAQPGKPKKSKMFFMEAKVGGGKPMMKSKK